MRLIRGATTIERDCKEEIKSAISELLREIFKRNALAKDEVRGFLFSVTTDIHSFHPARAARECGYDFAPLFACAEPKIDGQLPLCIRVMLFAELYNDKKPLSIMAATNKADPPFIDISFTFSSAAFITFTFS